MNLTILKKIPKPIKVLMGYNPHDFRYLWDGNREYRRCEECMTLEVYDETLKAWQKLR